MPIFISGVVEIYRVVCKIFTSMKETGMKNVFCCFAHTVYSRISLHRNLGDIRKNFVL